MDKQDPTRRRRDAEAAQIEDVAAILEAVGDRIERVLAREGDHLSAESRDDLTQLLRTLRGQSADGVARADERRAR